MLKNNKEVVKNIVLYGIVFIACILLIVSALGIYVESRISDCASKGEAHNMSYKWTYESGCEVLYNEKWENFDNLIFPSKTE